MASLGIGANHDSELVHSLKQQLLAQNAQYHTLQTQLLKRDEELRGMKSSFDDVLDKLQREADRALQLDDVVKRYTEDLQNERNTRQNTELALNAANERTKSSEQTAREYQAIIDKLSASTDASSNDRFKLEQEIQSLNSRVRELQSEVLVKEQLEQALLRQSQGANSKDKRGRRRSSSVSNFRLTSLEQELSDLRTLSAQQASELTKTAGKLAKAQNSLVRMENEKIASERRMQKEIEQLRASLDEQMEEVRAMDQSGGHDAAVRERELLERLEEEEARVQALEVELQRSVGKQKNEVEFLKQELSKTTELLESERTKVVEVEASLAKAVKQKDDACYARDKSVAETHELRQQISTLGPQPLITFAPMDDGSADLNTAEHVEKLLNAISRLRGERDELRRHLDFVQAESRCTIQDLQNKLTRLPPVSPSLREMQLEHQLQVATRHQTYSRNAVTALAVVVQQMEAQNTREAQSALEHGLRESVRNVQVELGAALVDLSVAESQTAGFKSTVQHLEDDIARERRAHEEIGISLAAAQAHIAELTKVLTDAEAARDAVALERTHLEQDLANVRQELAEANERYDKQLSAMGSHDATRALRAQIENLEQRVLRRNEQIGIQQNDIKRMETNLRLHEERIAEMSAELEVGHAERAAMVEDCRTTREERDDAQRRCESAEEMAESLDETRDAEVTTMVGVVFASLAKQKASARQFRSLMAARIAETSSAAAGLASAEAANARLSDEIGLSRLECDRLSQALEEKTNVLQALEEERSRASVELDASKDALDALRQELQQSISSATAAEEGKLALQASLDSAQQKLHEKLSALASAHEDLIILRGRLSQAEDDAAATAGEKVQLEETVRELEEARDLADKLYQETLAKLTESSEELRRHLLSSSERSEADDLQRKELDHLKAQYSEEANQLNAEVERLTNELKTAQDLHAATNTSHEETLQELIRSKADLEQQLADVRETLQAGARLDEEIEHVKARYEEKVRSMEEKLTEAARALHDALQDQEEAQAQSQAAVDRLTGDLAEASAQLEQKSALESELSRIRTEHGDQVQSLQAKIATVEAESRDVASKEIDSLKGQLEQTKAELQEASDSETKLLQSRLEAIQAQLTETEAAKAELQRTSADGLQSLQTQLDSAQAQLRMLEESKAELDAQLQSLSNDRSRTVAELQDRLSTAIEECSQVKSKLKDEIDEQRRQQEEHHSELTQAIETLRQSEAVREKALEELSDVSHKLEEAEASIKALQEEKTSTEFECTNLEAEIQRSKSLQQFQESKIKESERHLNSLKEELAQAQADCAKAQEAMKASEANLTTKHMQHAQELTTLRRELKSLQSNAKLAETVAELKEQNKEMERLLQSKCEEIEENDERFTKLMKEKRQFSSKIDSLTKKIDNLQTKLAATEAKLASSSQPQESAPRRTSSHQAVFSQSRPISQHTITSPPTLVPATVPAIPSSTPNSRTRSISVTTLSRPKTPDSKVSHPAVFRARTPESGRAVPHAPEPQAASMVASSSSSSMSIGKKRPAPDDFEICESVPAQVFTAAAQSVSGDSSEQPHVGTTPRIRRAVHAVRTGFTPMRGRVEAHPVSPRRATTGAPMLEVPMSVSTTASMPPSITDVTNSPRGASKNDQKSATARRGWLGKIRGPPSQAQRTAPPSRDLRPPVFEKPQQ